MEVGYQPAQGEKHSPPGKNAPIFTRANRHNSEKKRKILYHMFVMILTGVGRDAFPQAKKYFTFSNNENREQGVGHETACTTPAFPEGD
jgi:hypothetical protein